MVNLRQAASSTSAAQRDLTGYVNYKLDKEIGGRCIWLAAEAVAPRETVPDAA